MECNSNKTRIHRILRRTAKRSHTALTQTQMILRNDVLIKDIEIQNSDHLAQKALAESRLMEMMRRAHIEANEELIRDVNAVLDWFHNSNA